MTSAVSTSDVVSSGTGIQTLVDIADVLGGMSTAVGVVIALIGGWIAYRQLSGQQKIFWEQSYSSIFSEYVQISEAFFKNYPVDIELDSEEEISVFLREMAKVLHYLAHIHSIGSKRPEAFAPIDYVVLMSDGDALKARLVTLSDVWSSLFVRNKVLGFQFGELRGKLGSAITDDQAILIEQFEKEVAAAASNNKTTDEEDQKVYDDIKATLKRRFNHEVVTSVGDLSHPEMFKINRTMHILTLIREQTTELSEKIHAQAVASLEESQ